MRASIYRLMTWSQREIFFLIGLLIPAVLMLGFGKIAYEVAEGDSYCFR